MSIFLAPLSHAPFFCLSVPVQNGAGNASAFAAYT